MMARTHSFLKLYSRVFGLFAAMLFGALFPQLHTLSFLIQYLLVVMLFFSFLDLKLKPQTFPRSVIWVLLANAAVAFLSYAALVSFDRILALTAFMTAIAPTAIAAPAIIGFIQGEIEYVVASVIVTNVSSALIIPFTLPFLIGTEVRIAIWEVLEPVLIVMFVPLFLARIVSWLPTGAGNFFRERRWFSFPIWLANLFLISANASNFLRNENSNMVSLIPIALISLLLCIINFGLGALLGGRRNRQEASQSLGQKNLSFVIWIALTFINPLVAMGPTFYILYHHLYNSWSIYQFEKRRTL